jgi:hypothetical protein
LEPLGDRVVGHRAPDSLIEPVDPRIEDIQDLEQQIDLQPTDLGQAHRLEPGAARRITGRREPLVQPRPVERGFHPHRHRPR